MILGKGKCKNCKKREILFFITMGCLLICILLKNGKNKGEMDTEIDEGENEWSEWT